MSIPELRRIFKDFCKAFDKAVEEHERECARIHNEWLKKPFLPIPSRPPTNYPPYPEACRGMTCGAKTRAGTPCKLTSLYDSGRCKFHGGLSTGPITPEGKRRSAMNGFKAKNKRSSWRLHLTPVWGCDTKLMKTLQNLRWWQENTSFYKVYSQASSIVKVTKV